MQHAKNVPLGKRIVTQVVEVPGGSIEYRLAADALRHNVDSNEVRRQVESAIRDFRHQRNRRKPD